MKIKVIQPPYPYDSSELDACISYMISELEKCDSSYDLIQLPECCNSPCGCDDPEGIREMIVNNSEKLLSAAGSAAVRCECTVGINLYFPSDKHPGSFRNRTVLFDKTGKIAGNYLKKHLPESEYVNPVIDHSYLPDFAPPAVAEIDGIRYSFLTCYDTYYTEYYNKLSLYKPDIVIVCSEQRSEREDILEMQMKLLAFICNSYVVRAAYHMGENARGGGCSMIVAPDGTVLHNFRQGLGSFDCTIEDPHHKYYRSNGFGQGFVQSTYFQTHYRAPWFYRTAGPATRPTDADLPFPRLCAWRGMPDAIPENTLPSLSSAVSLGAAEVWIDVLLTKDGIPVLSADDDTFRLAGTHNEIHEISFDELKKLDPGNHFSPAFSGVGYASLEDVFRSLSCRTVFNIHLPTLPGVSDYGPVIEKITDLARDYDCLNHFYLSSENPDILLSAAKSPSLFSRCLIVPSSENFSEADLLNTAAGCGADRILVPENLCSDDLIQKAHSMGIRCGLNSCSSPDTARFRIGNGIDFIVTGRYALLHSGLGIC